MLHHEAVNPNTLVLIKDIMAIPLPERFRLVGGTALALQIGHRRSYDIDFFSDESFESDEILSLLKKKFRITLLRQTKASANITIKKIKVDFVCSPYPWLKKSKVSEAIKMAALEDIAAMKLLAITNRGRKRDFFDLWFLLKEFSFKELVGFFQNRYNDHELFMLTQSLAYFTDAEKDEDPKLLKEKISWEKVKEDILVELKLFHG